MYLPLSELIEDVDCCFFFQINLVIYYLILYDTMTFYIYKRKLGEVNNLSTETCAQ